MKVNQKMDAVALLQHGVRPTPGWSGADLTAVALLTLAGLLLRLPGLDHGLWVDEIRTLIDLVRLPAIEIVTQYLSPNNHVFYSLSAHAAVAWFGESAWTLRLPALIFGIATIPALYYLGRQLAGRQEAFLSCLFLAASYHHVWFSQNARGYTGLALGAVLISSLFLRLITSEKPSLPIVVGYSAAAAIATWNHPSAAIIVVAHALIWVVLAYGALRNGHWIAVTRVGTALVLAGLISILLYLPVIQSFQDVYIKEDVAPVIKPVNRHIWGTSRWVLEEFLRGAGQALPGGWPVLLIMVSAVTAGVVSYARQGAAVVATLLLPSVLTLAAIKGYGSVFFPRFMFASLPFLLLFGVRGGYMLAARLTPLLSRRHVMLAGCLVALAAASMVPSAWRPKQDFTAAVRFVEEARDPGDAVVCLEHTFVPVKRYLGLDCIEVLSIDELQPVEANHRRIWVIYTMPSDLKSIRGKVWANIQKLYQTVKVFEGTVGDGDIVVMLKSEEMPE